MSLVSTNPATGERFAEHEELTNEHDIGRLPWVASQAYEQWRDLPYAERAIPMRRLAVLLRERSSDLAEIEAKEMGRPVTACKAEIEKCAQTCEYYADNAESLLAEERMEVDGNQCAVRFDPLGVVLAVMPWNFPYWQVIRAGAPILMGGNVMLLKHASNVQGCAKALQDLFAAAGFPHGCFLNAPVRSSAVEQLLRSPFVVAATVTGGERAGAAVASLCGSLIKKTVLELGGNDAYIVLEDADFEACVQTALTARLQNSGQSCIAAKRIIVVDSLHDRFVARLKELVDTKVVMGDPLDPATTMGPLATLEGLEEIDAQVLDAVRIGATLAFGGKRADGPGWFYEPTILTDIAVDMRVANEETFGPVFTVFRVKDAEAAVRLANDSSFGLGAAVWTKDIELGKRLAARLNVGFVNINGMVKSHFALPVGGVGKSGYGRELGSYGIKEFMNAKTVRIG